MNDYDSYIYSTPPILSTRSNIFVTGGAGFIGYHLVNYLIDQGHSVTVFDNLSTGSIANISPKAKFIQGDVTSQSELSAAIKGHDLIIHLASIVGMRLAAVKQREAFMVSRFGTECLLENSDDTPVVMLSTSAIYGQSKPECPIREEGENSYAELLNVDGGSEGYACGKWHLEQLGRHFSAKKPVLVVRPFNVVGPRQRSQYGMVLPRFIKAALSNKNITVYDDGMQSRSFTDVHVFTKQLIKLIQKKDSWKVGENTFNIGNEVSTSIKALANKVVKATDSASTIEFIPYESVFPGKQDIRHRVPDCSRLYSLVGCVDWPRVDSIIRCVIESYDVLETT